MGKPKPDERQVHGILVLNKPGGHGGPTSAGCLNRIKRELGQPKIGHAGTLDPMASGVLPVLLGRATKVAGYLTAGDKQYVGELLLGLETDTWDAEGATVAERYPSVVREQDVLDDVSAWPELTEQVVPAYSAVKRGGKKLYELARAGREVEETVRPIRVSLAEVLEMDLPRVRFRVRCSAGGYVRSLAHSLGKRLAVGATLTSLIRERSGPFGLEQAWDLETLLAEPDALPSRILPLEAALDEREWPRLRLSAKAEAKVRNGLRLRPEEVGLTAGESPPAARRLFLDQHGAALALAEVLASPDAPGTGLWAVVRGLWESPDSVPKP